MNPELLNALLAAGLLDPATAEIVRRQLDPEAARAWAEATLTQATQAGLQGQQGRIIDLVVATDGNPSPAQLDRLWTGENERLLQVMRPALLDVASERAAMAGATSLVTSLAAGKGSTFDLINQGVLSWAEDYYIDPDGQTFGSIPNLNLAGRTAFQRAFTAWQQGELEIGSPAGLQQLIDALQGPFGAERATTIAVTETTRIFSEATKQAGRANPFTTSFRLLTSADERVCPQCGPLHGVVIAKAVDGFTHPTLGSVGWPPLHPLCRCSIVEETEGSLRVPFVDSFTFGGPTPSG
jgi:SPP1 gp7 family putative phage head morphogenesis protein